MLSEKEIAEIEERVTFQVHATGTLHLNHDEVKNLLATVKELRKENTEQRELLRKALPYVKQDLSSWDGELINQIEEAGK